ncbi:GNAT family N-acetyltransferase [Myxococcus sp. AM009]|uniref:GNAT family N-acetyltransferase n=1 Tax=unclassified Myxococcus TaxID=2648731 RepID=UPI001595B205|nr:MULTISPECIES: GNAT family N-acetyltransferase [unclassified Myxococcus]NVJ02085.1 GNAT family N-acetyltransferase [Myxococcus sp. AM009]NVJ14812.1 GNAT family N-acetyltransferase [Myxococcus sp. AM010]
MVEVRTFEGDAKEASRFINSVWQRTYGAKMGLTVWDERFFDWLLFSNPLADRDYLLGAYSKGKLVGAFLAEPAKIQLGQRQVDGTYGSWVSVAPENRGQGIGIKLSDTMRARHRERGAAITLGCVANGTLGQGFWGRRSHTRYLNGLGMWLHVFNTEKAVRWSLSVAERAFLTFTRPLHHRGFLAARTDGIRAYQPRDLSQCMALVQKMMRPVNLGYAYTSERLAHQLQFRDVPRTFVLERGGVIQGLVNYYTLQMTARGLLTTGLVDLLAFQDGLPFSEQRRLLWVAMQDMVTQDVDCAAMLRSPCTPAHLMLRSRWLPFPGGSRVTCLLTTPDVELPASPRVFMHLR